MFNWRAESGYIGRHSVSGIVNTAIGFSVIFLLTYLNFSPVVANFSGYAAGLVSGFYLSKKFVFRSDGSSVKQGIQYLAAFLVAFLVNLGVLKLILHFTLWHVMLAQLLAAVAYTSVIFLLSRSLIFSTRNPEERASS